MLINDGVTIGQLKSLVGRKGTVRFAGKSSKCTVEAVLVDDSGVKLSLRDEYNRRVKRSPFKFEPDGD